MYHQRALPAKTRRRPNAGLMLGQRLRWWANGKPKLGQGLMYVYRSRLLSLEMGYMCVTSTSNPISTNGDASIVIWNKITTTLL